MTILIDMDDVLENLSFAWVEWLNNEYGTEVEWNSTRDWDMSKSFPDLTPAQIYSPLYDDDFWQTVKPIDGAADVLKKLIDDGHQLYVVTTSNYTTLKTKMDDVLFKFYPFLDWNNVIVTANKQMIRGDVLIDDGPHNLMGGEYKKILMDAPHNRDFKEWFYGINRVHSWEEVYTLISNGFGDRPYVGIKTHTGGKKK